MFKKTDLYSAIKSEDSEAAVVQYTQQCSQYSGRKSFTLWPFCRSYVSASQLEVFNKIISTTDDSNDNWNHFSSGVN